MANDRPVNLPLIQRITGLWKRGAHQQTPSASPTTETSQKNVFYTWYLDELKISRERKDRYADFDQMDEEYPEISSALDMYADNATRPLKMRAGSHLRSSLRMRRSLRCSRRA